MHQSNQPEDGTLRGPAGQPQALDSGSRANPVRPAPSGSAEPSRLYTICALALVAFATLATLASWSLYPVFVDVYYHMAVVEGFRTAGGLVTHAFWEMAPAGRVHIYPPALHVAGCLLSLLGLSARTYLTLLSGVSYTACLLTTWLWLRKVLGPRPALFAVVFLCGPSAFWWNQAAHTANAAVLVVAPLALLALQSKRFLVCAALNFTTINLHPMGLFLPPALVANSLLRRKTVLAGLLAAAVPVLLYSPWLLHIWANRAFMGENRTIGNLGLGSHGVNLGLVMLACAVPGLLALCRRGGGAWSVLGPVLGFAVVLPMGLAGRLFMFNVHWPLACVGGLGLDFVLQQLEARKRWKSVAHMAALCVSVASLMVFPSLDVRPGPPHRPGGPLPGGGPPPPWRPPRHGAMPPPDAFGSPGAPRPRPGREPRPGCHVVVQPAALPQLFDGRPGAGFGPGPGEAAAMGLIHRRGADAFFAAVRQAVAVGDVIHVAEPPVASLIAGVTGRWTTSGILRDVRSGAPASPPDQCDYLVLTREMGGPPGPPMLGRERPQRFRADPPPSFEKVFENEFGSLWRNPNPPEHLRTPAPSVLSLPRLAGLVAVALGLVVVDLLRRPRRTARWVVPLLGTLMVAVCLWPLVQTAARELTDPPTPPPRPEFPRLTMDHDAIRRQHGTPPGCPGSGSARRTCVRRVVCRLDGHARRVPGRLSVSGIRRHEPVRVRREGGPGGVQQHAAAQLVSATCLRGSRSRAEHARRLRGGQRSGHLRTRWKSASPR